MALSSTEGTRALRHGVPGKSAYAETAPAGSGFENLLDGSFFI